MWLVTLDLISENLVWYFHNKYDTISIFALKSIVMLKLLEMFAYWITFVHYF
jgi:hypothetical protein